MRLQRYFYENEKNWFPLLHLVVLLVALRPQLLEGRRIVDDLALVGKAQQPLF